MAGPGGVALADGPSRYIALFIDFIILGIVGWIVNTITTSIFGDNFLGFLGLAYKTQSLLGAIITVVVMLAVTGVYFIYTSTGAGHVSYCAWHSWGTCSNGAGNFPARSFLDPSRRATFCEAMLSGPIVWITSIQPRCANAQSIAAVEPSTA